MRSKYAHSYLAKKGQIGEMFVPMNVEAGQQLGAQAKSAHIYEIFNLRSDFK